MRVHERNDFRRRGIGDLDEYEEDEEEQEDEEADYEEEEYEQEDPKSTKEQLEYLELRQRLKEAARQRIKKECSAAVGRSDEKKRKLPYDNYGSFFGPSQPVIAQRVIEESRAIKETQHIAAKVSNSHSNGPASSTVGRKSNVRDHPPKVLNEMKKKVQTLKDARDYSFLLSDDVELPVPAKEHALRKKKKVQTLKDTRDYSFLLSDDAELPLPAKEPALRKVLVPNSDARSAQVLSKSKLSTTKPSRPVTNDREEKPPVSKNRPMQTIVGYPKAVSMNRRELSSDDSRKRLGSNTGSGPGRLVGPKLPPKVPAPTMEKKTISAVGIKRPGPGALKAPLSKPPSTSKQYLEQKRESRGPEKSKMLQKQPKSSSKSQMKPPKQMPRPPPPRRALHEYRPKKRPAKYSDDEEDDGEMAIRMIRDMFSYNPDRYAGDDDDVSDMEANFEDIQKEERVSSKIGRAEDERELRLIEEEESRERLRKKKRRLNGR
eukprot:TRINITY_DN1292_c0_g2_i2.p1 TRINITY_DN1292_c0_g2~~TRINITY_DN1292_c0_g2_i2.p1  ORF type:complete len:489 (-),score=115.95 TRINITY_DN1292_c0_g2_i2:459-1925(-)